MTKLSDTQLVILSAAAQRADRNVLPLPGSLRGGAAAKVISALLSRGLIAETGTDSQTKADAALNRIWRNDEDGRATIPVEIRNRNLLLGTSLEVYALVSGEAGGKISSEACGQACGLRKSRKRPAKF